MDMDKHKHGNKENQSMKKPYLFVVFLNFKGTGTLSSLLISLYVTISG